MPAKAAPRVAMIGLGYIGLPTAALIARSGLQVTGVDVSPDVVASVNRGDTHIEEKDLAATVREVVEAGLLTASTSPPQSDFYLIAVPTPFKDGYEPDLRFVMDAARSIAPVLERGATIILESTSPVGTTEKICCLLAELRPDLAFPEHGGSESHDVRIAYCPERVLPGKILKELIANDRVIGGLSEICTAEAKTFYERFVEGECIATQARAAELTKLAENAFRDVNIAFANELANVSDQLDIDVWEVIRLANRHPRVNILNPGPGVGGHCIAVDPWFIVHSAPNDSKLIRTAREVNDGRVQRVVDSVIALAAQNNGPISCFGLAFKADIDDLRESPAVLVAKLLSAKFGSRVRICEPFISTLPEGLSATGATLVSLKEAMQSATLVMLVDHSDFKNISLAEREGKKVYDTRGIWQK